MDDKQLAIFQNDSGAIELSVDTSAETIWATQTQIAQLFEVTPQNVTMHIKSIYSDNEMDESATCKKSLQVQQEGNRAVKREVLQYNLDAIIAIGYRISSSRGTVFRKWATKLFVVTSLMDSLLILYVSSRTRVTSCKPLTT